MSETASVIIVVLLAVLVGGLVPVFYQAFMTLRSARRFIDATGPGVAQALSEFSETTRRLNALGATLEEQGTRLRPLVDSAASLGETLHGMGQSLRSVGSVLRALSPVLMAGVAAFFSARGRGDGGDRGDGDDAEGGDEASDAAAPEGEARRDAKARRDP